MHNVLCEILLRVVVDRLTECLAPIRQLNTSGNALENLILQCKVQQSVVTIQSLVVGQANIHHLILFGQPTLVVLAVNNITDNFRTVLLLLLAQINNRGCGVFKSRATTHFLRGKHTPHHIVGMIRDHHRNFRPPKLQCQNSKRCLE